jgi:hypothetical protein
VKFEPPRPKWTIPQCSKCQRYGHTQAYCYHSPWCVKCTGNLLTKHCPRKERLEHVKCALCDGNHPANYMWGDPKVTRSFFFEGWGALVPSAPAWCVYVTALHISWPSGILGKRSIETVWFFSWASVIVFVDFAMADLKEQRASFKFCFLLGKTAAQSCHNALRGF